MLQFDLFHYELKEINGIQYSRINIPETCIYFLCICSFLSSYCPICLLLNTLSGTAWIKITGIDIAMNMMRYFRIWWDQLFGLTELILSLGKHVLLLVLLAEVWPWKEMTGMRHILFIYEIIQKCSKLNRPKHPARRSYWRWCGKDYPTLSK